MFVNTPPVVVVTRQIVHNRAHISHAHGGGEVNIGKFLEGIDLNAASRGH